MRGLQWTKKSSQSLENTWQQLGSSKSFPNFRLSQTLKTSRRVSGLAPADREKKNQNERQRKHIPLTDN